jgi:catechol 2,3-dioxygenase-like lactoylglutathione lyase family enzyme
MRLALMALLVPDYDEGVAFFTAIGFDLAEDLDQGGGKRWVVVMAPGGGSGLLLARAIGDQRDAIGNQTGGRVGFFLHSKDFARDAARIEAAGGRFEETPRDEIYGRVAVFRDPFGNRWDLIEPRRS